MKLLTILFFLLFVTGSLFAQIQNVIVEKYYISDSNDATDTTDGRSLETGSITYRVYIDLKPGSKLLSVYGDTLHALKIESTQNFFNNIDRPAASFGYLINKLWFSSNPTLALDSWLTLGLAEKSHTGVLKIEDTDGSFIGGSHNSGGSSAIPGGLLVDSNSEAGIPLTVADGLMTNTNILAPWFDNGFKDAGNVDTTVFGSVNIGSSFVSNNAILQQNAGVHGLDSLSNNKVLVAQLTTQGQISLELNVSVIEPGSPFPDTVKYVAFAAAGDGAGVLVSPYLKYPPACGCRDPHYLEYSDRFSCDAQDSCRTHIVFGCMDTLACNYNPNANFSVSSLCCYPGYCNDRDLSVVCPSLGEAEGHFNIYPNPSANILFLKLTNENSEEVKYIIVDPFGKVMKETSIGAISGSILHPIDLSDLGPGLYLLRLYKGNSVESRTFFKD